MEELNTRPDWFQELKRNAPDERIYYPFATLDEFCGRFNLTTGKALSEIRRCKLWNCGKHSGKNFYARREGRKEDETYYIHLPEFDRYAAIIAAEKPLEPLTHPLFDESDDFHSKRLSLAVRAWEYARSAKPTKSNFSAKIDSFLDKQGIEGNERKRIKEICNPSPRGPKSKKIL